MYMLLCTCKHVVPVFINAISKQCPEIYIYICQFCVGSRCPVNGFMYLKNDSEALATCS